MIKKLCEICFANTAYVSKHGIPPMCDNCIVLNWKITNAVNALTNANNILENTFNVKEESK